MLQNSIVFSIFLIFAGAAIGATIALYTRQSLLVVYMLLGVLFGPWGLKLINDQAVIEQTGNIGILFLLFLLGLNLHPQNLLKMLQKVTWISLLSSALFGVVGYCIAHYFGFNPIESTVVGTAMMFSSTIMGLKLLPTTILHHQHTGEVMISVLLMQDILAIFTLLLLHGAGEGGISKADLIQIFVSFPGMILIAFLLERFVLVKLLSRFDQVQEYIFLLSIGWCLGMAEFARLLNLSDEIGAFIAGVAIASSPIALYISENLKPLRDFFLVMFFFSIGASINLHFLSEIIIPSAVLAAVMLVLKPVIFRALLHGTGETKQISWEVGIRLGQSSEFSLLVASLALGSALVGKQAYSFIQATTIITFIVSSYSVALKYPTPLAFNDKMRRD